MEFAIQCRGLTRSFGGRSAVDSIDLEVPERAVYGFVGRNGAGKTTTIRLLLGLLRPDSGSARIFGLDVARKRRAAARLIGAMVETPSHYDHLTGRENLEITRLLLGAPRAEIGRVLALAELAYAADRRVGTYSLGMRQRLGIARALLGRPKLLILDEPTNGLDPEGIRDMRALIAGLPDAEGVTILVSSHVLAEVEQVATHIGLMHDGRLLMQAPARSSSRARRSGSRFRVDRPGVLDRPARRNGHRRAVEAPGLVAVAPAWPKPPRARSPRSISAWSSEASRSAASSVAEPSLEDIFLNAVAARRNGSPPEEKICSPPSSPS